MTKKVGQILVEAGVIDERQLEIALAEQAKTGERLGTVLADRGFASDESVSRALARQSGVEHWDLESVEIEPGAAELLPETVARRLSALPLRVSEGNLLVAMSNPTDIVAIDEIQRRTDLFVLVVSCSHRQLMRAVERIHRREGEASARIDTLIARCQEEIGRRGKGDPEASGIVQLVEEVLTLGIRRDATDVHFQPDKRVVRVRFRIDGGLVQGPTLDRALHGPLVARIKLLADLDISETRVPQDGRIRFEFENRVIDMRVSTFTSVLGESVVIRILDRDRQVFSVDTLGLDDRGKEILRRAVRRPTGLILAAGPTGSGKTTTLFALLRTIDSSRRNVITLEDPVEYEIPLVTQCQVNERAGLTFATGLRAILRHDPDVLLVGEMRDAETASLALRAALTGHVVLSTLHTNDAVRTLGRLIDMGLDAYLIASCLSAVAAQRLVRRVCGHCRYEYEPQTSELAAVGIPPQAEGRFSRGKGCQRCNGTGERGREALFEVLEVTPEIAQLVSRKSHADELERRARESGMCSFRELATQRALEGEITLEEVARVTTEF